MLLKRRMEDRRPWLSMVRARRGQEGKKNFKVKDKHEAVTLALQETLKGSVTSKVTREDKKRQEREGRSNKSVSRDSKEET